MGTGTGPYGDCRSTQCCVAVWSRWLESATRRVGFRALKKTLEAPYTTKVNNRVPTTRGTTQRDLAGSLHIVENLEKRAHSITAGPPTKMAGSRQGKSTSIVDDSLKNRRFRRNRRRFGSSISTPSQEVHRIIPHRSSIGSTDAAPRRAPSTARARTVPPEEANQRDLDETAQSVDSLNAPDTPIQWIRADLG